MYYKSCLIRLLIYLTLTLPRHFLQIFFFLHHLFVQQRQLPICIIFFFSNP